ncbi:hypothetical protein BC831DRAFT_553248 [Entophlyctis helioformis]|nr:hypothetical protein BC831DRAFT_553248 [Entophlyctis helioformis]
MHSSLILALAASALSLVGAVPQARPSANNEIAPWIDLQPAVLSLNDLSDSNKFGCKLTSMPKGPVTVYFEHPSISFSDCFVRFDQTNWNITKEIGVTPIPVFGQYVGANTTIPLSIRVHAAADADGYHNAEVELPCKRKPAVGGVCTSLGDPHFKSFDGLSFSSQPLGNHHLVKSADLNIQVIQDRCGDHVTCNTAVAIRYGSSIMIYDIRNKQSKPQMAQVTPHKDGLTYTAPKASGGVGTHTVTTPCGSTITITHFTDGFPLLDVTVHLAGGYTKVGGMCNRLPGESNTKLNDANGNICSHKKQQDVNRFISTWKVAENEDLFKGRYSQTTNAPSKGTAAIRRCTIPEIPKVVQPEIKPKPPVLPLYIPPVTTAQITTEAATTTTTSIIATSTTTVVESTTIVLSTATVLVPATTRTVTASASSATELATSTLVVPASFTTTVVPVTSTVTATLTVPVVATTTTVVTIPVLQASTTTTATDATCTRPSPPPEFTHQCESHCKSLFTVPGCDKIVDPSFYIGACILDAKSTGSYAFTESAKTAYLALCHTQTTYMERDVKPEIIKQATTIQTQCGFGNNTCINKCSGNGVCADYGCACQPGWGGVDCSTNLTQRVQYNVESGKYETGVSPDVSNKGVLVGNGVPQKPATSVVETPAAETAAETPAAAPSETHGSSDYDRVDVVNSAAISLALGWQSVAALAVASLSLLV